MASHWTDSGSGCQLTFTDTDEHYRHPEAACATNTQQTWRQEFPGSRSSTVERSSTRTAAAGTFLRFLQTIFENTSLWRLKRLVTLSTYRRYINKCIYLSIYLMPLWCLCVYECLNLLSFLLTYLIWPRVSEANKHILTRWQHHAWMFIVLLNMTLVTASWIGVLRNVGEFLSACSHCAQISDINVVL